MNSFEGLTPQEFGVSTEHVRVGAEPLARSAHRSTPIPTQPGVPHACRGCGAAAPGELARVIGVWSVDAGRAAWDCESCTRSHLNAIEARRTRW
jgi:hypothetical protein